MDPLSGLPTIHHREALTREFERKIDEALLNVQKTCFHLTTAELLNCLNNCFSRHISSVLKYAIRQERHGNTDTPGGLES